MTTFTSEDRINAEKELFEPIPFAGMVSLNDINACQQFDCIFGTFPNPHDIQNNKNDHEK